MRYHDNPSSLHIPFDPERTATSFQSRPDALRTWTGRYGERHRMLRVTQFPAGVQSPRKVRIYFRSGRFLIQWWEPNQRKNVAESVSGDLIEAVARARQIEARLVGFRNSGRVSGKLAHSRLVDLFLEDVRSRSNAGELATATVRRYSSALSYYTAFADTITGRRHVSASTVDRSFALDFRTFLTQRRFLTDAGRRPQRKITECEFVWVSVRTMFRWAADPGRGNLIGEGFRNPFLRRPEQRRRHSADLFGVPDVTIAMATAFLKSCDNYQLPLFTTLIFFGLRAAEPCFLFREYIDGDFLKVPCNLALAYSTKGHRDKRLPLVEPIKATLLGVSDIRSGLLLVRRAVAEGREHPPLLGASLARLEYEVDHRVRIAENRGAEARQRIRDALLAEAGGVNYDRIEGEFHNIARSLSWPLSATLKDFRHLFATSLANAGMPEPYRKFLMGHAPGGRHDAIARYTHLDKLAVHYGKALDGEWSPLVAVLKERLNRANPIMA